MKEGHTPSTELEPASQVSKWDLQSLCTAVSKLPLRAGLEAVKREYVKSIERLFNLGATIRLFASTMKRLLYSRKRIAFSSLCEGGADHKKWIRRSTQGNQDFKVSAIIAAIKSSLPRSNIFAPASVQPCSINKQASVHFQTRENGPKHLQQLLKITVSKQQIEPVRPLSRFQFGEMQARTRRLYSSLEKGDVSIAFPSHSIPVQVLYKNDDARAPNASFDRRGPTRGKALGLVRTAKEQKSCHRQSVLLQSGARLGVRRQEVR